MELGAGRDDLMIFLNPHLLFYTFYVFLHKILKSARLHLYLRSSC
jgi:hypothetical protein